MANYISHVPPGASSGQGNQPALSAPELPADLLCGTCRFGPVHPAKCSAAPSRLRAFETMARLVTGKEDTFFQLIQEQDSLFLSGLFSRRHAVAEMRVGSRERWPWRIRRDLLR